MVSLVDAPAGCLNKKEQTSPPYMKLGVTFCVTVTKLFAAYVG